MTLGPLAHKRTILERRLEELGDLVVAYSGGVDSSVLTAAADRVLGDRVLAVTAVSPSLARRERAAAEDLARTFGWRHMVVETSELAREAYARNQADRCYWCKTELFEVLDPIARARSATIAVGTNCDDLGDHRPGLVAARRRGVAAPLVDAGMTKGDVRALAADLGLPTADKPAAPCLASRFAYGVRVTREGLERIDRAEELLHDLGFEVLRVRDHGDLARIEVPPEHIERVAALREELVTGLEKLGFKYVTLDLVGFRSGSMNEVLPGPTLIRRDA